MQCLDDTQGGRTNISVLVGLLPDTQNYGGGGGKLFRGITGACKSRNFAYLVRDRFCKKKNMNYYVGICIVDRIKFPYIIIWYSFDHEKQMFSVDSRMIHQNVHM